MISLSLRLVCRLTICTVFHICLLQLEKLTFLPPKILRNKLLREMDMDGDWRTNLQFTYTLHNIQKNET